MTQTQRCFGHSLYEFHVEGADFEGKNAGLCELNTIPSEGCVVKGEFSE
jgi:hypothetical protein